MVISRSIMNRPDQSRCNYCGTAFGFNDTCQICGVKNEVSERCQIGETRNYLQLPFKETYGEIIINVDAEIDSKYVHGHCFFCDSTATASLWLDGKRVLVCGRHYRRVMLGQGNAHLIKARVEGTRSTYVLTSDFDEIA